MSQRAPEKVDLKRRRHRRRKLVRLKRAVHAGLYLVPAETVARAILRHASLAVPVNQ